VHLLCVLPLFLVGHLVDLREQVASVCQVRQTQNFVLELVFFFLLLLILFTFLFAFDQLVVEG
jgi:hypothetical protein